MEPRPLEATHHKTFGGYGKPGSSKTHQTRCLIEEFGRDQVVILDCERGLAGIADLEPLVLPLIDTAALKDPSTGKKAFDALIDLYLMNFTQAYDYLLKNPMKHKWWVMDGFSALSDAVENYYQRLLDAGKFNTKKGDPDGYKMYAQVFKRLNAILIKFRLLPMNGYVNTLEDETVEKDKDGTISKRTFEPTLAGRKFGTRFPAAWDAIFRLYTTVTPKGKEFWANTQGSGSVVARIRTIQPIPRLCRFGLLKSDGTHEFLATDWSVVRFYKAMTQGGKA